VIDVSNGQAPCDVDVISLTRSSDFFAQLLFPLAFNVKQCIVFDGDASFGKQLFR
jgi:hypothetical protein